MNNNIFELLSSMGFSTKESKVYMALLSLGSVIVNDISRATGINRTTCYDVLEPLIQKGVVSKFRKKTKTYYSVAEPSKLLAYLDHEKNDFDKTIEKQKERVSQVLPELISLQYSQSSRPKIQFFEGEKGMREAYEDTLSAKGGILAYANIKTMHEGLPNFFPDYYKRRTDAKVHIKAIFPRNKESVNRSGRDQEEIRQSRFLPEGSQEFTPEVNIYNNKVLIASWKEKMAVIIESKEYADLHRVIYQTLWETLDR